MSLFEKNKSLTDVEIFTDGACSGNPGVGGWAAILRYQNKEKEIYGAEPNTTNNQMELRAIIEALKSLKRPCHILLATDSQYVMKGYTEWLPGWIARNWKTADKKPVANQQMWQELLDLSSRHQIEWKWIKGHNGHKENERCDELARTAIKAL